MTLYPTLAPALILVGVFMMASVGKIDWSAPHQAIPAFLTVIMMPLTLISGIYGMNFGNMPEIDWQHGYLFSLGMMACVAGGMLYYFRRKKWL